MEFINSIARYAPINQQEAVDQRVMLDFIVQNKDTVLLRENPIAHITSSGFILNEERSKVLLVHHNIRGVWGWTGGHADGDGDLLHVALKEAAEETGVQNIRPLSCDIASLDILPVFSHQKNGHFVNAHLHLSVAYLLVCSEREALRPCPDENSAVAWFDTAYFTEKHFDSFDTRLYNKLISKAVKI